jgi:uncharacterized membrane protein
LSRSGDGASRAASAALRAGTASAVILILAGLAAALLRREPLPDQAPPAAALLQDALAGRPGGLLGLGLVLLLATPAFRVAVLAWQFARRREWTMLAVSAAVLCVLGASVLAGRGEP